MGRCAWCFRMLFGRSVLRVFRLVAEDEQVLPGVVNGLRFEACLMAGIVTCGSCELLGISLRHCLCWSFGQHT